MPIVVRTPNRDASVYYDVSVEVGCDQSERLPFRFHAGCCALALPFLAGQAFAQGSAPAGAMAAPAAKNAQQDKMKQCNMDAAGKKGDERKAFMKGCLSDKPMAAEAAKPADPKQRMKMCNKDATGKKGDERKAFMKDCLSNKG